MATYQTREQAAAAALREQTLRQMAQGKHFSAAALKALLGR